MSIRIMTRVWDARGLPSSGVRLVLLKLADCANDAGERAFPSVERVARECELSARQVQRALRWLVDHDYIATIAPASHHRPTEWAVCLDANGVPYARTSSDDDERQGRHPVTPVDDDEGRRARPSGVTSMTVRGDIDGVADSIPRSTNDPSRSVSGARSLVGRVSLHGFETFWSAYPRKVGKQAAARVWQQLGLDRDHALQARILDAIAQQRQSEQWVKDGGQFIPHPQTWLRQGRWDDEPVALPSMNETTTKTLAAGARWLARQTEGARR